MVPRTAVVTSTSPASKIGPLQLVDWVYEQRIPPWQPYFGLLDRIHQHLVPRTYAEIGVSLGRSLTLALPGTIAIGVDPSPNVQFPLRRGTRVFNQTSDDFFADHNLRGLFGGLPLDLAFIDGMHRFEFALRDFMNIESASASESIVLIHDCLPVDELSADREQQTTIWSGDVWRLILLLRRWRPDLKVSVIDVAPTGLGLVRGLNSNSTVLRDHYEEIVDEFMSVPYSFIDEDKSARLGVESSDWSTVNSLLPDTPFRHQNVDLLKLIRAGCGIEPLARRALHFAVRGRTANLGST